MSFSSALPPPSKRKLANNDGSSQSSSSSPPADSPSKLATVLEMAAFTQRATMPILEALRDKEILSGKTIEALRHVVEYKDVHRPSGRSPRL